MGVLGKVKSGINLAGNIINAVGEVPLKQFYGVRDFYNFIRKSDNCPMANNTFFTVVPEFETKGLAGMIGDLFKLSTWTNLIGLGQNGQSVGKDPANNVFAFTEYTLARFALGISNIEMPSLNGFTTQTIQTTVGKYTVLNNNSTFNTGNNSTFTINFYELAMPVIESFIIPWMLQMNKAHIYYDNAVELPRLNLNIKFYRQDEIAGLDFMMNPSFVYRITGCYPIAATLLKPRHAGSSGSNISERNVTFAYNNIMVFSNAEYERFITGTRTAFNYDGLSPIQILNKLNSGVGTGIGLVNQAKNVF